MITQDQLKERLSYDPETGLFTHKRSGNGIKKGAIAGSHDTGKYIQIRINRTLYSAHRLAFLYMTGQIPNEIDHINGIRDDNRWANLQKTSRKKNMRNRKISSNNTSGRPGVYLHGEKWRVLIGTEHLHLGYYDTFEEAVAVRQKAEKERGYTVRGAETGDIGL